MHIAIPVVSFLIVVLFSVAGYFLLIKKNDNVEEIETPSLPIVHSKHISNVSKKASKEAIDVVSRTVSPEAAPSHDQLISVKKDLDDKITKVISKIPPAPRIPPHLNAIAMKKAVETTSQSMDTITPKVHPQLKAIAKLSAINAVMKTISSSETPPPSVPSPPPAPPLPPPPQLVVSTGDVDSAGDNVVVSSPPPAPPLPPPPQLVVSTGDDSVEGYELFPSDVPIVCKPEGQEQKFITLTTEQVDALRNSFSDDAEFVAKQESEIQEMCKKRCDNLGEKCNTFSIRTGTATPKFAICHTDTTGIDTTDTLQLNTIPISDPTKGNSNKSRCYIKK